MSRDQDPPSNVFIRFKQHVDSNIASGFNTMLGLPSPPSRPQGSASTQTTNTTSPNSGPTTGSSCPRPLSDSEAQAASIISWDTVLLGVSPYSPRALRHLPPPVPNDLPSHLEASSSIFTFEDAFEDLLIASQGQPLPDIATRFGQRKLLHSMFPSGEPAWFWLQRLRSQGLIDSPSRSSPWTQPDPDWARLHGELERRAADVWKGVADQADDELSPSDFFHQLGRTFRRIEDAFSEKDEVHTKPDHDKDVAQPREPERREPDHLEELFSLAESAFSEPQKTWDTFLKAIEQHHHSPPPEKVSHNAEKEAYRPEETAQAPPQVITKEEYVDRFGYLHSKIITKTLDEEGREIGSETSYTIRSADKQDNPEASGESGAQVQVRASGKSGWFWK